MDITTTIAVIFLVNVVPIVILLSVRLDMKYQNKLKNRSDFSETKQHGEKL